MKNESRGAKMVALVEREEAARQSLDNIFGLEP
jgi:hypothetical protein